MSNEVSDIAKIKFNIASNYFEMDRYDLALKELDESLSISGAYGLSMDIGYIYYYKTLIYIKTEDLQMALAYWQKSLEIFERINDLRLKFKLMYIRGIIARKQKKYKFSEKCFLESKKLLLKSNYKLFYAENEFEMGILYTYWGKKDLALSAFDKADSIFKKMKILHMVEKIETEKKKLNAISNHLELFGF